ncbi:MAG TPA: sodium:proton exchanger, partial [Xanthomonadaceae bacterium]|nr:sodium:proton exchanger [Xanthomonadaceae bacterium]
VGLKLDLGHVRHIGPVALATGLGQLTFTSVIGFFLVLALGKDPMTALYVAVALTFSSTIIIVKLLSDKRELDSLHGRIAVGFLIVQDIAVVLAMMVMSALGGPGASEASSDPVALVVSIAWRIAAAVVAVFVLMRYVMPWLVAQMARSQELLLIFALSWAVALAALGAWAGFSMEAGAFIAGFTLASTRFREAINARLGGIRDFLLLFFFIYLGLELDLSTLADELLPATLLALFVLIGNPLIVMAIMGFMGYRKRTGFLAGLTVAQISEFSIVFVAMGITLGHIGEEALSLTTLVGLITITLSTYMILYSAPLYERLSPWLGAFERRNPFRETDEARSALAEIPAPQVLVFGLGRYGRRVLERLHAEGVPVLGIDFDPENVDRLHRRKLPVCFGDAESTEFVERLPLSGVQWVISALPQFEDQRTLLGGLRGTGFSGRIAVVVREHLPAHRLRGLGVDRVFQPFQDAADHAGGQILAALRGEPRGA